MSIPITSKNIITWYKKLTHLHLAMIRLRKQRGNYVHYREQLIHLILTKHYGNLKTINENMHLVYRMWAVKWLYSGFNFKINVAPTLRQLKWILNIVISPIIHLSLEREEDTGAYCYILVSRPLLCLESIHVSRRSLFLIHWYYVTTKPCPCTSCGLQGTWLAGLLAINEFEAAQCGRVMGNNK